MMGIASGVISWSPAQAVAIARSARESSHDFTGTILAKLNRFSEG
jgi:hypothetical protein